MKRLIRKLLSFVGKYLVNPLILISGIFVLYIFGLIISLLSHQESFASSGASSITLRLIVSTVIASLFVDLLAVIYTFRKLKKVQSDSLGLKLLEEISADHKSQLSRL